MIEKTKNIEYKFRFSFVIPVYNVEAYLAETVESLLNQTMDFQKYCEIIFVNDGSTDASKRVCLEYKKKYPNNITYIEQENSGPGAARNVGAELAKGKYINPIDSDDKLSPDTLEEVYGFFEEHYDEIDLVALKWELFEARTGGHPLNYKFTKDRVIDLTTEYTAIQTSVAPAFFKAEVFRKHKFDPAVGRYGEDARVMGEILLERPSYGVVKKPTYFYRKRLAQTSSQDSNLTDKFWYLDTPSLVWGDLFSYAKNNNKGKVPQFIQFMAMYDLQWRFKQCEQSVLSDVELQDYKYVLYSLLKDIDDEIIMRQRNIYVEHKLFILGKKYGVNILKSADHEGPNYSYKGHVIYNGYQNYITTLDIVEQDKNSVTLYGRVSGMLFDDAKFGCKISGIFYQAEKVRRPYDEVRFFDEVIYDRNSFKITVPIQDGDNVKFILRIPGNDERSLEVKPGRFSQLPPYARGMSYTQVGDYLMCHVKRDMLVFVKKTGILVWKKELKYLPILIIRLVRRLLQSRVRHLKTLRKTWKWKLHKKHEKASLSSVKQKGELSISNVSRRNSFYKRAISRFRKNAKNVRTTVLVLRLAYFVTKPFFKRDVWIVTDRITAADDNGEVFFKFLSTQPNDRFDAYFVIDKESQDYQRLKEYGKVVDFFSFKHKLLFLHAKKVISSEATEFVLNPFFEKATYLRDLINFEFVFLQHGIIRDDISEWLNKYSKNIKLLVTSTKAEYASIIQGDYGYTSKEVVLTGLPRYDNLISEPKKKLIIMPTWRQSIVGNPIKGSDMREYNPLFKKSEFFTFWNSIIQDERIANALKANNMKAELYLHHTLRAQVRDFKRPRHVKIMNFPYDYPKAKREGSLLLTDYSSVALDFAYLKKPIIYAQFDEATYYDSSTSSRGYLSYEEEGLGPITYDYESTVNMVVRTINSGCKMSKKYQDRVDNFFYKFDTNNSHRVYQAILSLDEPTHYIDKVVKKPRRQISGMPLKLYWWRYRYPQELNFGDEITPYIMRSLWGVDIEWSSPEECMVAGAGSIIELLQDNTHDNDVKVWGSGFIRSGKENDMDNLDFYAVRGPQSLSRIYAKRKVAMGDPGLLVNMVFKPSKLKKYRVGVVPHYVDVNSKALDAIRSNPDYLVIDVLQTPDKVALDITSCEYIVSSSLHGLIFADSFNIPNNWMPLSDKLSGGDYKFYDYYQSTNRELNKVDTSILGDAKRIEEAIRAYTPIKNLKAIQRGLIDSFPLKELIKK